MEVMHKLAFDLVSIIPSSTPPTATFCPYRMFAPYRVLGVIYATKGWISVDRGSKATLPLTMPYRVLSHLQRIQSMDLTEFQSKEDPTTILSNRSNPLACARGNACTSLLWVKRRSLSLSAASLAWILT